MLRHAKGDEPRRVILRSADTDTAGERDMLPLEGKAAIVTGAGRHVGMGRAIALALAEAGADVAVTARPRPSETYAESERAIGWRGAESVAEEIRALGRRSLALPLDVTEASQVKEMVRQTVSELGQIDVLVNNAAANPGPDRVRVVDLEDDLWEHVLRTNLTGAFLCSKYVARLMIEQGRGGKIVNMSSVHGRRGEIQRAAYCASKFGVIGFTQALSQEMAPFKVNVNAVCPGIIETERVSGWGAIEAKAWGVSLEEAKARWLQAIPWGRTGLPEDVARVVVFLASDASEYVTGQAINVDGGRYMN
jgi:NAD(P)-dependent dehydrogenase (short-subunit alcohol dehydrogenase family)